MCVVVSISVELLRVGRWMGARDPVGPLFSQLRGRPIAGTGRERLRKIKPGNA